MQTLNPQTLPKNDNVNPYAFCLDVNGETFIQKGKMIAYYGGLRFETLGTSVLDTVLGHAFNAPAYVRDFVVVSGRGQLLLGDRGNHINSYDLENGNLTVRAANVLGFDSSLVCQESTVQGFLTLLGTGKFLASSNGQVHFLESPARVDEDALLGWADLPCPSYRYDYAHVRGLLQATGTLLGVRSSGEEKQLDFSGVGTILVQSSEDALAGRSTLNSVMAQMSGLHQSDLQALQTHIASRLNNR